MSIRSITIESVSVDDFKRFKAAVKAGTGNPNEVAKRILAAGLAAVEAPAKPKAAKKKAAKKTTAKAPAVEASSPDVTTS